MTATRPQDPTPPAEPVAREPRARRGSRWRRLLAGAAFGGALAAVGPVAGAADRVPLIAPRPAARVRIAPPQADAAAKLRAAATFFEPAPEAEAKPEITAGPAALRSPTGPSAPLRLLPTRFGKPLTARGPGSLADPAGPREADRLAPVRRIEPVLPGARLSVPAVRGDGYRGDEGVVTVADREKEDADDLAGPDTPADAADLDDPAVETDPPPPLDPLAVACDEAIRVTAARLLTGEARGTATNTPWQIGHGLMALREDYTLLADGRRVRALDWLAGGPTFKGEPWFERGPHGPKAHPYSGVMYDFEGHPNQILAFLAMSDVPQSFTLRDGSGRPFTVADWIRTAQREVRLNPREEVTWTLWAFSVYLDSEAAWTNARGERWSMERLVREETNSVVEKHACGGTHGLYALASARNARLQGGHHLRGQWLLAHEKVGRYAALARRLQNPDGSFSDRYFQGRSHQRDLVTRIGSSGHTLEFLMMALPQSELGAAWVRAAVGRVSTDLLTGQHGAIGGRAVGGMYHAVHALKLYRERTAEDFTPVRLQTAGRPDGRVVR